MKPHRRAFSLSDLLFFLFVIALLAALLLPALAKVRELARRSKCGKLANQITMGHNEYATNLNQRGLPEKFLAGTEPATGKGSGGVGTDGSRALAYFVRKNHVDSAIAFACPSDPFVAILDASGDSLGENDTDLPTEGKPAPQQWASRNSVAAKEAGHTFFSYSMQSGSKSGFANPSPKMNARLPLVIERNPNCAVFRDFGVGNEAEAARGNTWNHNREGQTLAFADGHNFFLSDAGQLQVPTNPDRFDKADGFDHVYQDEARGDLPRNKVGKCVPAGTAAMAAAAFGSWATD